MEKIIYGIFLFLSINTLAQNDTTVNTSRDNPTLQAVLNVESKRILFAGQEYVFNLTTSGQYDIRITAKNAKVELIEESKRTTGGFRYKVTPINPGEMSMTIRNVINEKSQVSLLGQTYSVINYPTPPIQLVGADNGQILDTINDSTTIICAYPFEYGINDTYEVKSWTGKIGDKVYFGNGPLLSMELINYINQVDNEFLHLRVELFENKTGHNETEGVYLIKKNKKE